VCDLAGWIIWFAIAAVLVAVEMLTLTFYLLWMAIGALAGASTSFLFPDLLTVQLLTGAGVALLLTLFTKPLTRRFRSGAAFRDAIDGLVGKEGIVVEAIALGKPGIVRVGSETWSATAEEQLEVNQLVVITHRGTTMLQVRSLGGEQ
jgi:membrane protein implicated in regulation of membrane protease activity